MTKTTILFLLLASCLILPFSGARAEQSSASAAILDEGQRHLLDQWVIAINDNDEAKLKSLYHPKSLACINDETREFFDNIFSAELAKSVPEGYEVIDIQEVAKDGMLPFEAAFDYPVRPSHSLQIDFVTAPNASTRMIRAIVREGDAWLFISPCPKPETIERFNNTRVEREKQKTRANILVKGLKDPLLSEIRTLLREGKKIAAIKKYSAETGESLSMAKDVISLIDLEQ